MAKSNFLNKLKKGDTPTRGLGIIAIKACEDDIKTGLESGYTLKQIHTVLEKENRMPIGYAMFQRHVKKIIKLEETKKNSDTKTVEKNTKKKKPGQSGNKVEFNPHSSDDMDKFV